MTVQDFCNKWLGEPEKFANGFSPNQAKELLSDIHKIQCNSTGSELKYKHLIDGWFDIAAKQPQLGMKVDIKYPNGTFAHDRVVTEENLSHYISRDVYWKPKK